MRRLDVSPDPVLMLSAALEEAAKAAGLELAIQDGAMFLTL
jgi:DNA-binding response OmpR family regulator